MDLFEHVERFTLAHMSGSQRDKAKIGALVRAGQAAYLKAVEESETAPVPAGFEVYLAAELGLTRRTDNVIHVPAKRWKAPK